MNILKHYELVTYFVPLLGSLSGARKSCFQFWQTSNSPPLRSLIITIPIIVTTPSTGVPQISNWPTPDAFKLPFKYFPCKFKLRNIPRIFREYCNFYTREGDETASLATIPFHISFVELVPGKKFWRIFGTNM